MKNPLISIIIPIYNPGDYLDECLSSVYEQTYENWECIIINDGTLDHAMEIADFWVKKDKRFIILEKENSGVSDTRNIGIKNSKGDLILFLDADDFITENRLEIAIEDFLTIENLDVSFSNFGYYKNNAMEDNVFYYSESHFLPEKIIAEWDLTYTFAIHCIVLRRELIEDFRFNLDLSAKVDWDLWMHVFSHYPKVRIHNKVVNYYRVHENVITRDPERMRANEIKINKYFLKKFPMYGDLLIERLLKKIQKLEEINDLHQKTITTVYSTKSYRIGNFLLKPFSKIFKFK